MCRANIKKSTSDDVEVRRSVVNVWRSKTRTTCAEWDMFVVGMCWSVFNDVSKLRISDGLLT